MPVIDDFHQVKYLFSRELFYRKVVQYEKIKLRQTFEEFGKPAFYACLFLLIVIRDSFLWLDAVFLEKLSARKYFVLKSWSYINHIF